MFIMQQMFHKFQFRVDCISNATQFPTQFDFKHLSIIFISIITFVSINSIVHNQIISFALSNTTLITNDNIYFTQYQI